MRRSQVFALHQQGLTFLAEVSDRSPELIGLQYRRGETALKLVYPFYAFLAEVEEGRQLFETGMARWIAALGTLAVPSTLRPGGEHHPEGSRHCLDTHGRWAHMTAGSCWIFKRRVLAR